jgi:hypothetical protein
VPLAPPGEKTERASIVGVLEPELCPEPGRLDVEAKRFDMELFPRRKGSEAIDDDGEVGLCLGSSCELPVSEYSEALDWFGSSSGFIWPPPAFAVVCYAMRIVVWHESRRCGDAIGRGFYRSKGS